MDIFVNQETIHPRSVWRKHSGGFKEKILEPIIYFPSSSPNQTYLKKVFLSIFSQKFSIYPKRIS